MYSPIDVIFDSSQVGTLQVTGTTDKPCFTLLPAIEDCVGVAVNYVNVPFTYFIIDGTNNQFYIRNNSIPTKYSCVLEEGSYNSINFCTQVKAAIAATNYPDELEIYVDTTNSKLVIYKLTNTADAPTLNFDIFGGPELARIMGFTGNSNHIYTGTTATFFDESDNEMVGVGNLKAGNVINLSGPAQMYLDSDLGSSIFGSVRNQAGNRGLLGFWPINCNYQGTIEYLNLNPDMFPMTRTKISRINLSLTLGNRTEYKVNGKTSDHLQLNGEAFQVGLRFWKKINEGTENSDNLGNQSVSVQSSAGQIFNPKRFKKSSVHS